ncbi:unnamed protein product [Fusarium fujikuroi]|uniref:Uncharacterized protein n=1 Tax=Fusarium fujikuroi TaxID=5127 RepID=A0A9Q9UFF6_FUSFU|nr:unnamed protein product [Fusarium fujikuroi]
MPAFRGDSEPFSITLKIDTFRRKGYRSYLITNRANRYLVNASIYLLEYNLYIFYIPKKKNFIPNAFSYLKALETDKNIKRLYPNYIALNNIYIGIELLISQETRDKFI